MFRDSEDIPAQVKDQESYQVFIAEEKRFRKKYIRSLVAFFLLGMCNNIGSKVLLTAAEDIMEVNTVANVTPWNSTPWNSTYSYTERHCLEFGTGAILLAFLITGAVISSIMPFLPSLLHMNIFLCILLSIMGFCLISLARRALTVALVGVVLLSTAEVLGEVSFLRYTTYFHGNVISTWSSGTGCAELKPDFLVQMEDVGAETLKEHKRLRMRFYRSVIAFWILGTCNNLGVSAMLAGAVNIIEVNVETVENTTETGIRDCTMSSTGLILVCQCIGGVGTTMIAPFIPMVIHCRIISCLLLYAAGFILVAFIKDFIEVALVGIALVSISSALGEVTFLQYAAYFKKETILTFSSGTGAAGVIGSISYTLGVENGYKYTMLGMIIIPMFMGLVFWFLLPVPTEEDKQGVAIQRSWNEREIKTPWMVIVKKSHLVPKVIYKYIAPLGAVYMFEYFINQGLYELIKVEDTLIQKHMQYQWLQVAYQIGVFISRSSVNCIYIKHIWILAVFQLFNVAIFTTCAIYMYIDNYWVLFALAFEEGLFGGAAYVNTYVKIGKEEPEEEKQFMSSMTCFGNNAAIMLAGFLAILAHNLICKLPAPKNM